MNYGFMGETASTSSIKTRKADTICISQRRRRIRRIVSREVLPTPLQKYTFFNIRKKKCVFFSVVFKV